MPSGGTSLPLVSNGPTANPTFQLLTVPGGGIGTASLGTGVLIGQGISTVITASPLSVATGGIGTSSLGTGVVIGQGTAAATTAATTSGIPFVSQGSTNAPLFTTTLVGPILINDNATFILTGLTGAVLRVMQADATTARVEVDSFASNAAFVGARANGTAGGPTALLANDVIFNFQGAGYDGTGYSAGQGFAQFAAAENWNATSHGTQFRILTTPLGTTIPSTAIVVQPSGGVSLGTTTDPGSGSIEATGKMILLSATPLTTTGNAVLLFGNVASFGIFMGTGTPSPGVLAGTGSLYLRSEGTGTSSRAYINTNGGSGWAAITTVS